MPICLKPKPKTIDECFMSSLPQSPPQVSSTGMRLEIELLLCAARTYLNPPTAQRLSTLLKEDIDWTYLIQIATCHKVMPLLYQSLSTIGSEAVPPEILAQLHDHFRRNTMQNLFLTQELLKLLEQFKEKNIPVIPYKGPVLAASAYGKLSLRQSGDLDLLVSAQNYPQAKALLLEQGYQMVLDSKHEKAHLQAQLWNEKLRVSVDLHYGIPPKDLRLNPERFWESLQTLSLNDKKIQVLSPEAHLLILCVDGHKESWNQLFKLCGVAAIIYAHPAMDWGKLIAWAEQLSMKQILYMALLLANELLGTILPEEILQRAKASLVRRFLVKHWREYLFSGTQSQTEVSQNKLFHPQTIAPLYRLSMAEFKNMVMPTEVDQAWFPLPPAVSFLYYLLRPIRLVWKYGPVFIDRSATS
jgi:hypothetical protein